MFSPRRHRRESHRPSMNQPRSANRAAYRDHSKSRRRIVKRKPGVGFDPPEDWYEPTGGKGYRVIVKDPGKEYRHVVTPEQIRSRLSQLPQEFLKDLEVVQLSRMTRKKHFCPCYGLQWGCAIYLYPFDESLDEYFYSPPPQYLVIETKMFGARWEEPESGVWRLVWSETSARDFQLNNVLIHELGHLIDDRNHSYIDQERYAEWFAIEYGYLASGGQELRKPRRKVRRRHHGN